MKYNWGNMTDADKFKAVEEEMDLVTHMGTTKDDFIEIMRFLNRQLEQANASDADKEKYNIELYNRTKDAEHKAKELSSELEQYKKAYKMLCRDTCVVNTADPEFEFNSTIDLEKYYLEQVKAGENNA